jgi:pullulanase
LYCRRTALGLVCRSSDFESNRENSIAHINIIKPWYQRLTLLTVLGLCGLAKPCLALEARISAPVSELIASAPPDLKACESKDVQQVLVAKTDTRTISAKAVWLNSRLIQWAGKSTDLTPTSRFKLVASPNAQLVAQDGQALRGVSNSVPLAISNEALNPAMAARFKFVPQGLLLALPAGQQEQLRQLLRQEVLLVHEDENGRLIEATRLQQAAVLDDLYSTAADQTLGAQVVAGATHFTLWAPTAQRVVVCLFARNEGVASAVLPMQLDEQSGIWRTHAKSHLRKAPEWYYQYLVDVIVPGIGLVRNTVTDPYSVSLGANSRRSFAVDLDAPNLQIKGWQTTPAPQIRNQTDMSVYELHVRDFSINDASVPANYRGKFMAFTVKNSAGMRHLQALAKAGLSDIHLLPVFDIASVPEEGCISPQMDKRQAKRPDGSGQRDTVAPTAASDCFNWGYDPFHFNAPEGSYATSAADGKRRIIEFRKMVHALHQSGLRVGMDVVYNHTAAAGQKAHSVLDRIVPGYYHRLNALGEVEQSTCCDNTATENLMMGKLMLDSVVLWAKHYKIDSFRFDLMAHQPRDVMEALQVRLKKETGRAIQLLGEGWNFGEIANGARFVQASQLSLNGSNIATFSDRARDAIRGGGPSDSGAALLQRNGYVSGLDEAGAQRLALLKAADMVRVGLAGSLRQFTFQTFDGSTKSLAEIDYNGQPAGYVSQPSEVVNYVENHDNQTLFDLLAYKLPSNTSKADRARRQMLASAFTALSQGIAYFHAGQDILRSKSLDRNSYDSGDWFNRIDWTYRDNYFATGLPPQKENAANETVMRELLSNALIKPSSAEIVWSREAFLDLLRIRASTSLFRLPNTEDIRARLRFDNLGSTQNGKVIAMHLDGNQLEGANFREVMVLFNVASDTQTIEVASEQQKKYLLHPVHLREKAADQRVKQLARYNAETGSFQLPPLSLVVFVVR